MISLAMAWTRSASHPTRCDSTRPDTGWCVPGASGLPPHTAPNAVHVAVDVSSDPATTTTVLDSAPHSNYVNSREPSAARPRRSEASCGPSANGYTNAADTRPRQVSQSDAGLGLGTMGTR
jgi:hypothetical protein